jgi:ribose-phosphate pyrophosphokinase
MTTINLIHPSKSEIKYHIDSYPDGEIHMVLEDSIEYLDKIKIKSRIKSSDDLFILLQFLDIVKINNCLESRNCNIELELHIYYCITQRMDRVMSNKRPYSLRIMWNILITEFRHHDIVVKLYEPHSDKFQKNLDDFCPTYEILVPWAKYVLNRYNPLETIICFPDEGAKKRYKDLFEEWNTIRGVKVRNNKGEITHYHLDQTSLSLNRFTKLKNICVIDDLCDGGRTFLELYHELNRYFPSVNKILHITHVIQRDALLHLATLYNKVICTNSFNDWDIIFNNPTTVDSNIEIIDVLSN